jgi:hypothetical protein
MQASIQDRPRKGKAQMSKPTGRPTHFDEWRTLSGGFHGSVTRIELRPAWLLEERGGSYWFLDEAGDEFFTNEPLPEIPWGIWCGACVDAANPHVCSRDPQIKALG